MGSETRAASVVKHSDPGSPFRSHRIPSSPPLSQINTVLLTAVIAQLLHSATRSHCPSLIYGIHRRVFRDVESLPLFCWVITISVMFVVAPPARLWYRYYELTDTPSYTGLGEMAAAQEVGQTQFKLASAMVAAELVSSYAIIKPNYAAYFCVAPVVSSAAERDELLRYARELDRQDATDEEDAAAGAAAEEHSPVLLRWAHFVGAHRHGERRRAGAARAGASFNVSAWAAAPRAKDPCVDKSEMHCETDKFGAQQCHSTRAVPTLTRRFKGGATFKAWASGSPTQREAVVVGREANVANPSAWFRRAAEASRLTSAEDVPLVWWGVDLAGLRQCRLDNAVTVLVLWWVSLVLVIASAHFMPQVAGVLAITFVVLAWMCSEVLYSHASCLHDFRVGAASELI
jgi:hypothetical protein